MYDKLGALLSEVLEEGRVKFVRIEKENVSPEPAAVSEPVVEKEYSSEQLRAFKCLHIEPGASLEEIKKAYRSRLKNFHPDHYQNNEILKKIAEKKTKEIIESYNLLCSLN